MQDIITLSKILSKQKIKDLELFTADSKQLELYKGIVSGNIISVENAYEILYNGKARKKSLQMLQYRLRNKLLNALFHIDLNQPRFSDFSRTKINVHKNWSFVNILLEHNARPIAIQICEEAFRKASKFGLTDLQILLGRLLMRHFGYLSINKKKHKYYEKVVFEKLEVLKQELITEKYYADISQDYVVKKSSSNKKMKEKLDRYCLELSEYEHQNKTYIICLYYYKILIGKHLLEEDFLKAKEVGIKGLTYFTNKEIRTPIAEFLFRQTLHICHMQLKEYDQALEHIKINLDLVTPYKFNWYKEWGYYFGWAVVTKNYTEMLRATFITTSHKSVKEYPRLYETWTIKEAYVQILIRLDLIERQILNKYKLGKFRINRFINEVPKYSQDKRGLNISILIAHFIHLLLNKKYDLILNKIDNLKQYSFRYLRNDITLRSNCFIKIISKIPESNYHPEALKRNTKSIYKKLQMTKYSYTDNPSEIEVIPYETLWELILQILAKSKNKKRA